MAHLGLVVSGCLLFATMFVPLPAAFGVAMALWAHAVGIPLPAILGLYILQDVLSYLIIRWLLHLPAGRRLVSRLPFRGRSPSWLRRLAHGPFRPSTVTAAGLLPVTMLSFYAGAVLAGAHRVAPLKAATVVISIDVLKYVNGIAVALGAVRLLPSSPWTVGAASMLGLAVTLLWRGLAAAPRPQPMLVRIRNR